MEAESGRKRRPKTKIQDSRGTQGGQRRGRPFAGAIIRAGATPVVVIPAEVIRAGLSGGGYPGVDTRRVPGRRGTIRWPGHERA